MERRAAALDDVRHWPRCAEILGEFRSVEIQASSLKSFGVVLGSATGLAIIAAVIQAFFLERIKGWIEKQRLDITHGQKIVEEMVKHLHDYAQKYYMPLGRTAKQFINSSRGAHYEDAFYFFTLHHYFRNKLADELGGYFLRDATAEVVISRLARTALDAFGTPKGFLGWAEVDQLVSDLLPSPNKTDRPKFKSKIAEGWGLEKYQQFRALIEGNSAEIQEALRNFEAFVLLLLLEVNLGYGAWYGEVHADLPEGVYDTIVKSVDELVTLQTLPRTEADAYKARLNKYVIRQPAKA